MEIDHTERSLNLTLPTLLVLLLGVPTQATASIDTSALVGSTAGGLSINQGAANYTIPITVPPRLKPTPNCPLPVLEL